MRGIQCRGNAGHNAQGCKHISNRRSPTRALGHPFVSEAATISTPMLPWTVAPPGQPRPRARPAAVCLLSDTCGHEAVPASVRLHGGTQAATVPRVPTHLLVAQGQISQCSPRRELRLGPPDLNQETSPQLPVRSTGRKCGLLQGIRPSAGERPRVEIGSPCLIPA
jgi:hypothetical protein